MREKRHHAAKTRLHARITPACAGKTDLSFGAFFMPRDHPRVCGKNCKQQVWKITHLGSPPRVREKPFVRLHASQATGITPACAGKTHDVGSYVRFDRDHPRVCGKNTDAGKRKAASAGSPPRVREKRRCISSVNRLIGITPACAGKTKKSQKCWRFVEDHPRVCGKNLLFLFSINFAQGSPPRVREKLLKIPVQSCFN